MRTTLREARTQAGVSMADLAARLEVSVSSVSTLELNDERGAAKVATVERALDALGLQRWDTVLPATELTDIMERAKQTVDDVAWTMALEAQTLTDEAKTSLYQRLVAEAIAAR